jgi:hypothetical protein
MKPATRSFPVGWCVLAAGMAGCGSTATAGGAGIVHRFLNGLPGFPSAFLEPADQFLLLTVSVLEIVVRELAPFLFQFALGNVPVALDFQFVHDDEWDGIDVGYAGLSA